MFAKLTSSIPEMNVESYYKHLCQTNPMSDTGVIAFTPEQFNHLVNMIQNENDAKVATDVSQT